jgi:hypothetical protein
MNQRPLSGALRRQLNGEDRAFPAARSAARPEQPRLGGKRSPGCYHAVMEQALGSWKQEGRISLWRYRRPPRMYAGWHFAADKNACASLLRLCDILSKSTEPSYRTLTVTDPVAVGVDRIFGDHDLRLDVPEKLRLSNDLDGAGSVGLSAGVFCLPLRPEDASHFSEAVKDISADHADLARGSAPLVPRPPRRPDPGASWRRSKNRPRFTRRMLRNILRDRDGV